MDKSCAVGEYLDYENCKCRRKLVNKLIEELKHNENVHKCSSCTLYIASFSILFTIKVGIGTYFVCFDWYLKKDAPCIEFGTRTQTTIY